MRRKLVLVISAMVVVSGLPLAISSIGSSHDEESETDVVWETGAVAYLYFEGGFYGIVGQDGKHYDPVNLPSSMKVEGLHLRFTARKLMIATYHMWGTPIHIIEAYPIP